MADETQVAIEETDEEREARKTAERKAEEKQFVERGKLQAALVLAIGNTLRGLPELKGAVIVRVKNGGQRYDERAQIRLLLPDGEGLQIDIAKDTPKDLYWGEAFED